MLSGNEILQGSAGRVRFAEPAPPAVDAVWAGSRGAAHRNAADPAQQYAVLLLSEDQMAHLLQRPAMRQVNQRLLPARRSYAAYTQVMRRARVVIVALAILVAGVTVWARVPLPALSAFPWAGAGVAPTISTGASFSLAVASPRGADAAAAIAGRLTAIGVPAFTRAVQNRPVHQVMVGPYVSLDEAEALQHRLARHGFGGARMFVDDSLRHAPRNEVVGPPDANPGLVLVGAPGRLALALEMRTEPRQVSTRRVDDTTVDINIGPLDGAVSARDWSAPEGVHLIQQVAVEEVAGSGPKYARARLTVPAFARTNTRVEGRRVYVDLTWPQEQVASKAAAAPAVALRAARPITAATAEQPAPAAVQNTMPAAAAPVAAPAAGESLAPVVERFERVLPFLQSAAKAPSPDVLGALVPTIDALDASLRQMTGTGETAAARGLLISATASARRTVNPAFSGNRVAEAYQAAGLFEAAKALIPVTRSAR